LRAWNNEKNPNLLPHWNRLVLASEFPELLPVPSVQLAEITFWEPARSRIQSLGVPEAFMAWMKAWFVLALILACPWISYQLWLFVAAGLYGHERKMVYLCLPASIGLFLLGAAMAFAFVFDPVLDFLFSYNRKLGINIEPRFKDWIGFVLLLPIGFGVSFQLPLVMLALERIGIVTLESFISRWRIYILAIFFVSMILTPADPVSMLLMAIPLTVLYFLGILLCRNMPRSMRQPAA
jgi:sec-independent protein translocase protein TatC